MEKVVFAIDPGYVNFACCCIKSSNLAKPSYWHNGPLFEGVFSEEKLAAAIYAWIKQPHIKLMLDQADKIVLERQMTMKFQAINHCVRFLYWEKTVEYNPKTVGKYFGLSTDRASKKKEAVAIVAANAPFPIKKGKKDDLADAYLLAAYHHFLQNPQLKEGFTDVRIESGIDKGSARKKPKTGGAAKRLDRGGLDGSTSINKGGYFIDLVSSSYAGSSEES